MSKTLTGKIYSQPKETLNSAVDTKDQDLIKKLATDIKAIFLFRDLTQKTKKQPVRKLTITKLKGEGIIKLLTEIYGKCYCEKSGCYCKVKTLAKATGQSEIQVYRQLAKLRKAGIIERIGKGQPETKLTGRHTYFLTTDFIYTLGILKKTFYQFRIRHTTHKRVVNNSIIKVLKRFTEDTSDSIDKRYFIDFLKQVNVDYDKNEMLHYDKKLSRAILSKLNEIKNKHEVNLTLFKLRYNKSILNSTAKVETEHKEIAVNNREWITQEKARQKALLKAYENTQRNEVLQPVLTG